MELKGLGFVPLLLAFWCAAWLATSYIMTVVLGHAASPLMSISDVGNFFPESILFRIGLIGTSIGTLVLTFLIYKYMVMHTEEFRGHVFSPKEYPRIHFVSTIISITCEALYYLGQSIQMYKLPGAKKVIHHSRCTCCGLTFVCVIFYFGYETLKKLFYNDEDWDEIREIPIIIIEWVMLLLILINIVTYYSTMQRLLLTVSRNSCTLSLMVKIDDFGV
ncbi:uncharacterized protein LOC130368140 [Hyla sarda]|uniref:uncharacterized protein LOC130368140 n=1 Tax=Hyla sarda TaxID=327740 RepID=UPI0024C2DD44|nr:uncharacterized protein LOC130368140 [Hyla sarda]